MFIQRLFWQFFLSIMAVVLLTAALSIQFERFVRKHQSPQQIDANIAHLLTFRDELISLLAQEDFATLTDRLLKQPEYYQQFLIFDEFANELFDRIYEDSPPTNKRFDYMLHQEFKSRGLALNTWVTSDWGQLFYLQIQPRMHFQPLFSPRFAGTVVRTLLLLLLSGLVCYLLTRRLTRRIGYLQQAVQRLSAGQYAQAFEHKKPFTNDELGQLSKDFQQMAKQLAQSEQARKRMLTDISHELRSPLARLQVALAIARDRFPAAEPLILRVEKEAQRMNQLIAQIIKIQKQEIGQNENSYPVEINALLSKLLDDVRYEYQQTDQSIYAVFNEKQLWVSGQATQLQSAFENIFRNAMSHTPENSQVEIAVWRQKGQGIITVKDAGGGVAEHELEKIFQPFVRLDNSRNRRTGGYGLGLSIAKTIITQHQGRIWAENINPTGLQITITLPCT